MPTFYNFTDNGLVYSFDDVFVPADLFREGNLFTWGDNVDGQLGINNIIDISTPVTTFSGGANWKQVTGARGYTAAIKTDGTLWNWGLFTKLGVNDLFADRYTPVTTFAGGTNWKQVASGVFSTAAIKTDGTLWTWGDNADGQLGINNTADRTIPTTTFAGGTNWKQVACGGYYTTALKTDGTLWVWGDNQYGQLGINDINGRTTPVTTFAGGNNWKQVACGRFTTTAIKTDGTLWVWGYNGIQLGTNDATNKSTPVTTFAGGNNWRQVSCGSDSHTAAIKTDGTLWVWGRGAEGQLGTNNTNFTLTPVTTFAGGTNWKQVSCGDGHTAAIKTDGTLWVWGYNNNAQLGINNTIDISTPVTTFAGGTNWKQVDCGLDHTTAITYIDPAI